jgi:hypothetical protein
VGDLAIANLFLKDIPGHGHQKTPFPGWKRGFYVTTEMLRLHLAAIAT